MIFWVFYCLIYLFIGISNIKCSENMIALGGGDGLRLINGINW